LEKDNALWVISKTKIKINKLPLWNDEISIRTWPMGAEGVRCNRCYQIMKDGEVYINGITEWVIIDATSRTLRKVETTSYPNDIDWIQKKSIEEKFRRFKDDFTEEDFVYKRLVRSGDIDVTHHTNNVTYITMLLDTFSVKELEAKQWNGIEVSYLNESFEGETLSIYRKEREDGYSFSIKKEDGKVVLMAFFQ
jgi:acyl-ACP thioesterase